jgi:hypothetical protein
MQSSRIIEAVILAVGLAVSAFIISTGLGHFKALDRSVEVKGLAEREVPADVAIWPISFVETGNDLGDLYKTLQDKNGIIIKFAEDSGFRPDEISISAPSITDRQAQNYGNPQASQYRYSGKSTVTVYTHNVEAVLSAMRKLSQLGERGIALDSQNYEQRTQFLFTGLNALKPPMIEEATKNARLSAEKFAKDSQSQLGKIRHASQGQFSIEDRDASTPNIKKVRVVSTVDYYLSD